jgi:hypothetical protein
LTIGGGLVVTLGFLIKFASVFERGGWDGEYGGWRGVGFVGGCAGLVLAGLEVG